jgi:hypothetical protein
MKMRMPGSFLRNSEASASVEFIVVFLALISTIFFVIEVTLYFFFMASVEKAAEAGVRTVVTSPNLIVSTPAYPTTNTPVGNNAQLYGQACDASTCNPLPERRCSGPGGPEAPCNPLHFPRILAHMRGFNGQIEGRDVTVTYSHSGIGFAGGPAVPMVTVEVSGVPFQTGILGLLLRSQENQQTLAQLGGTLPARTASMTGEGLAR